MFNKNLTKELMMTEKTTTERIIAGRVKSPLLDTVEKLHDLGYTDTDIVRHGVRDLAKKEKVPA
jgi:hypothetical protein